MPAKSGADTKTLSAIERIETLYEHMQTSNFESPMEDETFRYITVPANDEERVVKFFRNGYSPAADHPGNDARYVVLKIDKVQHHNAYLEACDQLKAIVTGSSPETERNKAVNVSRAEQGKPRTKEELMDALPETDDDAADES